ncbi:MAG: aminotransferase class V-fold PLP-dependent enzyme, partial [Candidatus Eremiobacteraeota bacterium]|nr:aminotransferase class V-fold PLP-dependent enzyme [Candidatus Eremiobacteraeota bacterium]
MTTPLPRSEFAVTERFIYLNHASAGVLPLSSVAAIDDFARAHAGRGVLGTFPYDLQMPEYRERIGRFVGAAGTQIALLSNTSAAANTIASGLDWRPGDEVVLCDNEFPANVIPWIALRRRGVVLRFLPTAQQRLTPDVLRREISARTRVVAVSWVSYADGYRHDLCGLADQAHRVGAFLCVDAMQGLGVLPVDVKSSGVDALYSGAAKWMLGLHGVAMLYLSERIRERLELAMPGWRSMRDMWDFHNYEQPFSADAMRFEAGTPALIGALSLASSVALFTRSGPEAIARHVLELTERLCMGLRRIGAEITTQRGEGISSGIVTFSIPGSDSLELGAALEKRRIVTTYRARGVR